LISSDKIARVFVASVLAFKSLVVKLWCVDASSCCIASINGARIVVSARDWSVDAVSINARVSGAFVVVIAILSFVLADSSCAVASVDGACIVVVTILLVGIWSLRSSASCNCAFVSWLSDWNWSVDAFSSNA
jgi:hypothetical protein